MEDQGRSDLPDLPSRPSRHLAAAKFYGDSLWNSSFPSLVSLPIVIMIMQEASLAVLFLIIVCHPSAAWYCTDKEKVVPFPPEG